MVLLIIKIMIDKRIKVFTSKEIKKLTKNKKYADQHPDLYCSQSFSLGRVGGDIVEDVDQHQEQGDQEGHPA